MHLLVDGAINASTRPASRAGPNSGPVTFALGELLANFGNNRALVALTENGARRPAGRSSSCRAT